MPSLLVKFPFDRRQVPSSSASAPCDSITLSGHLWARYRSCRETWHRTRRKSRCPAEHPCQQAPESAKRQVPNESNTTTDAHRNHANQLQKNFQCRDTRARSSTVFAPRTSASQLSTSAWVTKSFTSPGTARMRSFMDMTPSLDRSYVLNRSRMVFA